MTGAGMAEWEVYALRYAVHEERLGRGNLLRGRDLHDHPVPMDYYVRALRQGARSIVVDTGFSAEGGAGRGRRLRRPVGDSLAALGVDCRRVGDVIVTHLHYDHAGNKTAR